MRANSTRCMRGAGSSKCFTANSNYKWRVVTCCKATRRRPRRRRSPRCSWPAHWSHSSAWRCPPRRVARGRPSEPCASAETSAGEHPGVVASAQRRAETCVRGNGTLTRAPGSPTNLRLCAANTASTKLSTQSPPAYAEMAAHDLAHLHIFTLSIRRNQECLTELRLAVAVIDSFHRFAFLLHRCLNISTFASAEFVDAAPSEGTQKSAYRSLIHSAPICDFTETWYEFLVDCMQAAGVLSHNATNVGTTATIR